MVDSKESLARASGRQRLQVTLTASPRMPGPQIAFIEINSIDLQALDEFIDCRPRSRALGL